MIILGFQKVILTLIRTQYICLPAWSWWVLYYANWVESHQTWCCSGLPEKFRDVQQVKEFPAFMESENLLPCAQKFTFESTLEPFKYSLCIKSPFI